jgi:hypothetical protein
MDHDAKVRDDVRSFRSEAKRETRTVAQEDARATSLAWVGLLACTVVVVGAGFALTFHGLYDFGRDVAHWPLPLPAFGPIADDGLTLVAIAAQFLLAHAKAPWRPRAYAWFVFMVGNAASIIGNAAGALHLKGAWPGAVGAALCPVFVTLAAHLGVICWKYARVQVQSDAVGQTTGAKVDTPSKPRPAAATSAPTVTPPPAGPTPRPAQPAPKPAREPAQRPGQRSVPAQRAEALRLLDLGQSAAAVAIAVGKSKRTVELWRKDAASDGQSPSVSVLSGPTADTDTGQEAPERVNGHHPASSEAI